MSNRKTYSMVKVLKPAGWILEYERKWVGPQYNDYADDHDGPRFKRKGSFAGNCTNYESAHDIELRSHYSGSGPTAFGGASRWPVITSKIAFNENDYGLAVEFARDLGEFVDGWLKTRGL